MVSPYYAVWVFITAMFAMFAFAALTQGWMRISLKWWEYFTLAVVSFGLLMPGMIAEKTINRFVGVEPFTTGRWSTVVVGVVALAIFATLYVLQVHRERKGVQRSLTTA